jgi:hypothetical protein
LLAAMSILWTWPLVLHLQDHIPGLPGDNYSFLWNLWWMRKALSAPELDFFQSQYLFSPFGVDLINHPHTALQAYLSATVFSGLSIIQAENFYVITSVFLNAACAYALACDMTGDRRMALLAGIAFGGSPYVGAHLLGHFDLLTAWVIPLFALFLRRSLRTGRVAPAIGGGVCLAVAAYAAYYHVVYLALLAVAYVAASWHVVRASIETRPQHQALFTVRLILVGFAAKFSITGIGTMTEELMVIAGLGLAIIGILVPVSYYLLEKEDKDAKKIATTACLFLIFLLPFSLLV